MIGKIFVRAFFIEANWPRKNKDRHNFLLINTFSQPAFNSNPQNPCVKCVCKVVTNITIDIKSFSGSIYNVIFFNPFEPDSRVLSKSVL